MCQYSAADGSATDWHLQHLMQLAISRAGMVVRRGDGGGAHRAHLARLPRPLLGRQRGGARARARSGAARRGAGHALCDPDRACRAQGVLPAAVGGRQAADARRGCLADGRALRRSLHPGRAAARRRSTPRASRASPPRSVRRRSAPFASASTPSSCMARTAICCTRSSPRSPTSARTPTAAARRTACASRSRWRARCAPRCRAAMALGARITGTDWADGGLGADDAVAFAAALEAAGLDYVCVSGGGAVPNVKIALGPGYQVPFAAKVKAATGLVTRAVGLIATPEQARGHRRLGPGRLRRPRPRLPRRRRAGCGTRPSAWAPRSPSAAALRARVAPPGPAPRSLRPDVA